MLQIEVLGYLFGKGNSNLRPCTKAHQDLIKADDARRLALGEKIAPVDFKEGVDYRLHIHTKESVSQLSSLLQGPLLLQKDEVLSAAFLMCLDNRDTALALRQKVEDAMAAHDLVAILRSNGSKTTARQIWAANNNGAASSEGDASPTPEPELPHDRDQPCRNDR